MITLAQYKQIAARHSDSMGAVSPADYALADALFEESTEAITDPGARLDAIALHDAAVRHRGTNGEDATRVEFFDHISGLIKQPRGSRN